MTLDISTIVAIYFLIGLFIAGFGTAFGDSPGQFVLILFLWPLVLFMIAVIVIVVTPVVLGKWIGTRIKDLF